MWRLVVVALSHALSAAVYFRVKRGAGNSKFLKKLWCVVCVYTIILILLLQLLLLLLLELVRYTRRRFSIYLSSSHLFVFCGGRWITYCVWIYRPSRSQPRPIFTIYPHCNGKWSDTNMRQIFFLRRGPLTSSRRGGDGSGLRRGRFRFRRKDPVYCREQPVYIVLVAPASTQHASFRVCFYFCYRIRAACPRSPFATCVCLLWHFLHLCQPCLIADSDTHDALRPIYHQGRHQSWSFSRKSI